MGQSQICDNLSGTTRQLPWEGSLGGVRLLISDLPLIISIDHRAVFGDDERVGVVFADDGA